MRKTNKVIYIDYDNTLIGVDGLPIIDAQPTLMRFKRQNHKIVIFSARAAHPDLIHSMAETLSIHKIPFDKITNIKGQADYYIDDRNIVFTTWAEVGEQI